MNLLTFYNFQRQQAEKVTNISLSLPFRLCTPHRTQWERRTKKHELLFNLHSNFIIFSLSSEAKQQPSSGKLSCFETMLSSQGKSFFNYQSSSLSYQRVSVEGLPWKKSSQGMCVWWIILRLLCNWFKILFSLVKFPFLEFVIVFLVENM